MCVDAECLRGKLPPQNLLEMTGIQAIERQEKDLPLRSGKVPRQEFEYIRHGTQALIANFDVVTGQIIRPTKETPEPKMTLPNIFGKQLQATLIPKNGISLWIVLTPINPNL